MKFSEFKVPTYEEWREATEKSLRGKSFDTLLTKLLDDITLDPMYQQKDIKNNKIEAAVPGQYPFTRGTTVTKKTWKVSQELSAATPALLNEVAKHDLSRGQNVYHIVLDENVLEAKNPSLGGHGVPVYDREDVEEIFADIDVQQVHIDAGEVSLPMLASVHSVAGSVEGVLAADPVHQLAKTGNLTYSLEEAYNHLATAVTWASEQAPSLRTVLVQTHVYHNGGASPAVELAVALSTGVAYVKALVDRGISASEAGKAITFAFSVGSEYFSELSKLRAARTLWAAIMKEFGADEDAQKMAIHARTSSFTKTAKDTYVNMLRGTAEAFAATAAGVESLHVSAFDEAVKEASSFSRRIARNTSLILQEESHIDKTVDPSGGSWYVEHLTEQLAEKAWSFFQQIEQDGGMVAALQSGLVQKWINDAWETRIRDVETRKQVIVGVNQYVNLDEENEEDVRSEEVEQALKQYEAKVAGKNETVNELKQVHSIEEIIQLVEQHIPLSVIHEKLGANGAAVLTVEKIENRRLSEPFEALQERSEQLAESGKEPVVYLVGIGKLAEYKPRADFITGFFQSGGFSIKSGDGEQAVKEASQYDLVVLCGKDEAYEEQAASLVKALKEQNEQGKLYIAGQEKEEIKGIDGYIHMKTNVYEFLHEMQQWMGGDNK